jgi:Tetratricopeptide repeat
MNSLQRHCVIVAASLALACWFVSPSIAQRAVLYEADSSNPQGKRFAGTVTWRTETVSPNGSHASELVVRADIEIPERHMAVTWSLRRNTDKALPASHTIEVTFNLPPDFPSGGISNVPGILMKDSEEVTGLPLAGLAVKITNNFFLIGLNAADAEMQRNVQLLKERTWFDILIVYSNGGRAILTMEKGPPGERAFTEAFAAWGQAPPSIALSGDVDVDELNRRITELFQAGKYAEATQLAQQVLAAYEKALGPNNPSVAPR